MSESRLYDWVIKLKCDVVNNFQIHHRIKVKETSNAKLKGTRLMTFKDLHIYEALDTDFVQKENENKTVEKQIRTERITDLESFKKLCDQWNELAIKAEVPVYMSFDWLYRWWKHFGRHPKRELFVLVIYRGSELIGIAPMFLGISSIGPIVIQKRLSLMGSGVSKNELLGFTDDYGYSDFLDFIAHPGYRSIVADKITDFLLTNTLDVDVVCLQHVSDDSFVMTNIFPRLENYLKELQLEKTDKCPYLRLPDSMDEYKDNQLGSSSRRRRYRKNLNPVDNKYAVEKITNWDQVKERLEILIELHQDRWNRRGYPGTFYDERHRNFMLDMSKAACKKGWLWFAEARDDNRFGAVRMALKYHEVYYDWLTGFDGTASISKYRPGLGLLSLLIKEGIDSGASKVELLRGAERYKFDFTRQSRNNWRMTMPLYLRKSFFRVMLNELLNSLTEGYYRLQREWTLLKVHYQEKGFFKMFYSYGAFRAGTITEKLEDINLFSRNND